jgi:pilus assembly protein CpaB
MTYRLRNIVIAVALAAVAALLTVFWVTNYKRNVEEGEKDVTVFVAARDIPAGSSGEAILDRDLLEERHVDRRNVAPGAISSPEQIADEVAVDAVYAGEQVTTRRFAAPEERGIRADLSGNLRAMRVPGDSHQLLAGEVKAGDRIDVVATWKFPADSQNYVSRVVLRDLLVLEGVKQTGDSQQLTRPNSQIAVTLALTDSQASKMFFAMQNGEWSLALRPTDEAADSPEGAETAGTLLFDGLAGRQVGKLANPKAGRSAE